MNPPILTPDLAVSYMRVITKFDDAELLDAALRLILGASGLDDAERDQPHRVSLRDDFARAALDFGYRKTSDCDRHCEEYLGIAV